MTKPQQEAETLGFVAGRRLRFQVRIVYEAIPNIPTAATRETVSRILQQEWVHRMEPDRTCWVDVPETTED